MTWMRNLSIKKIRGELIKNLLMTTRHFLLNSALSACFIFLPAMECSAESQVAPSSKIIAEVLKAYGGVDAIKQITSVIAKGRIFNFMSGTDGKYSRYIEHPKKLRIEVMPDQSGEVFILNGNKGFQSGINGLVETSPAMLQSLIYQYSYLDLPMGFVNSNNKITYDGKHQVAGHNSDLLLVNLRDAPVLRVFIDEKTRLIVKVSANFNMGKAGFSELAAEYHDYRPVAGVMFPHRLINYADGTKLSEISLKEIVANRKIPATIFLP